jgi:hypothetical protein
LGEQPVVLGVDVLDDEDDEQAVRTAGGRGRLERGQPDRR